MNGKEHKGPRVRVTGTAAIFNGDWVRVRIRKATRCALTGKWMPVGAAAYRPMTDEKSHRSERVKADAMEATHWFKRGRR